jgi:hypothetical protein
MIRIDEELLGSYVAGKLCCWEVMLLGNYVAGKLCCCIMVSLHHAGISRWSSSSSIHITSLRTCLLVSLNL